MKVALKFLRNLTSFIRASPCPPWPKLVLPRTVASCDW
jgi:hypothetical protein